VFSLNYKCSPSDKSGSQKNVNAISQKVYLLRILSWSSSSCHYWNCLLANLWCEFKSTKLRI